MGLIRDIRLCHRISVNADKIHLFSARIQYKQKQGICLSAICSLRHFLHGLILFINPHKEECQNILVISVNLILIFDPTILPNLFFRFRRLLRCQPGDR